MIFELFLRVSPSQCQPMVTPWKALIQDILGYIQIFKLSNSTFAFVPVEHVALGVSLTTRPGF